MILAMAAAGPGARAQNATAGNLTVAASNTAAANVTANAAANGNGTAAGNTTSATDAQYLLMVQFINLSPERLTELRKLIDKLDDMSAEDKAALKERVMQQMALIRSLRDALGGGIRTLSPRDRDVLRRYYVSLNPEDTQAWVDRAKAAKSPEETDAVVRDMLTSAVARGITPNPDYSDKPPGPPPGGPGGPGGPGDRRNGPGGGWYQPFGPDGGAQGLPPPRHDHDEEGNPPLPPPPSNTTVVPAGNTTPAAN
jgi:hypothetical protein